MTVANTLVSSVFVLLMSTVAFAECPAPAYQKGRLWLPGASRTYTASASITDFFPARMICLAERLRKDHIAEKHYQVYIFSSHEAAMCYHGPIDIGDRGPSANQEQARCESAPWSDHQLRALYSHHADDDAEYMALLPLGLGQPGTTRIDLPAKAIPHCVFEVGNRCLISMDYAWYAGNRSFTSAGTVTLAARFNKNGTLETVRVVETRDMIEDSELPISHAALENARSWRLEPGSGDDTAKVTYSQVIDPSLGGGEVDVQFDVPQRITIRVGPLSPHMRPRRPPPIDFDSVPFVIRSVAFYGTPPVIAWCWLLWRGVRSGAAWRRLMLMVGLLAVSVNAGMFYGWMAYASSERFSDPAWQFGSHLGTFMALPLGVIAVAGAAGGLGTTRLPLVLAALLGVLLWVPSNFP